jgi:hypothetical protein
MFRYQEHIFALVSGADLRSGLLASLRADPMLLRNALDGWFESRRADLDLDSLSVEAVEGGLREGSFELGFRETSWQACRMEWAFAPHNPRIRYRIDGSSLVLSTLPRNAFEERVDEL